MMLRTETGVRMVQYPISRRLPDVSGCGSELGEQDGQTSTRLLTFRREAIKKGWRVNPQVPDNGRLHPTPATLFAALCKLALR